MPKIYDLAKWQKRADFASVFYSWYLVFGVWCLVAKKLPKQHRCQPKHKIRNTKHFMNSTFDELIKREDKLMKLAVSGKGGVGKTTFSALMIRTLNDDGKRVRRIVRAQGDARAQPSGRPQQEIRGPMFSDFNLSPGEDLQVFLQTLFGAPSLVQRDGTQDHVSSHLF